MSQQTRISDAQLIAGVTLQAKGPEDADFGDIMEVSSFPAIGSSSPQMKVTTIADAQEVYVAGLPDPGEMTLSVNFVTTSTQHQKLFAAQYKNPKDTFLFKAILADGTVFSWPGEIGGMKLNGGSAGNVLGADITISIKGRFQATWPAKKKG